MIIRKQSHVTILESAEMFPISEYKKLPANNLMTYRRIAESNGSPIGFVSEKTHEKSNSVSPNGEFSPIETPTQYIQKLEETKTNTLKQTLSKFEESKAQTIKEVIKGEISKNRMAMLLFLAKQRETLLNLKKEMSETCQISQNNNQRETFGFKKDFFEQIKKPSNNLSKQFEQKSDFSLERPFKIQNFGESSISLDQYSPIHIRGLSPVRHDFFRNNNNECYYMKFDEAYGFPVNQTNDIVQDLDCQRPFSLYEFPQLKE